nr:PREDICTED: 2-oxo-4-hydroxy-4-carboxy-5-ureidoimidazoline decarboxylase-like [Bemisia tabaci]
METSNVDGRMEIGDLNQMEESKFMMTFADVVEKCPEAAAFLLTHRPYMNANEVFSSLERFFYSLSTEDKMKILNLYPDLTATDKDMTKDSLHEHIKSGLTKITEHTRSSFEELNTLYREKFGFPFIMCVTGNDPGKILSSLQKRLRNDVESELNADLHEVKKISRIRLSNLIAA